MVSKVITLKEVLELIKSYDKIFLFFHELPDCDALGSCWGLKNFISKLYPSKTVKIAGEESLTDEQRKGFFASQSSLEVSSYKDENIFKEALGIVLDCNNEKRVFTGAQQFCKETIKIDHHPDIEDFTTYKYVDDKSAAATQIIGKMIKENYPDKIEDNIAKFLYLGILTDTNRFYYPSTSQETFDIGSWLYTNIKNKQEIYEAIYYNSVDHLKIQNKLFRYIRWDKANKFAFLIIPKNFERKYHLPIQGGFVYLMREIKGIDICCSTYFDKELNSWKCSIRSTTKPINEIAKKYGGGGHPLASGCKVSNLKQFKLLCDDLKSLNKS